MPLHSETQGKSADLYPALERRPGHILDHPRKPTQHEAHSHRGDQVRVMLESVDVSRDRVRLAGRRGMHRSEPVERELQRIRLMTLERVLRLRPPIHANHLESRPRIPHRRSTGATKKVQKSRLHEGSLITPLTSVPNQFT